MNCKIRNDVALCHYEAKPKQSNVYERSTRLIATRLAPLAMTDRDVSLALNMTTHPLPPPQGRGNKAESPKKRAQSYGEAIAQRRFEDYNF